MATFAAMNPSAAALDVATGTGSVAFELAQHIGPDGRIVGVDITLAMVHRALEQRSVEKAVTPVTRVQFAVADTAKLPFSEASFDVVTCRFSIHHFAYPEAGLEEMVRVLRPGGRLVIGEFSLPEEPGQARRLNHLERLRNPSHIEAFSGSRLREMMADVGCPVRDYRDFTRWTGAGAWMSAANTKSENREEILRLLRKDLDEQQYGVATERDGDDFRLMFQDVVLWGQSSG